VSFDLAEFRLDDFFVDVFAVDDESHGDDHGARSEGRKV
jgi:hypothetical protein